MVKFIELISEKDLDVDEGKTELVDLVVVIIVVVDVIMVALEVVSVVGTGAASVDKA